MKKNKDINGFSESEWEKLASMLSGEKVSDSELLRDFMENDPFHTGENWQKINDMTGDKIDVDKAWNKVMDRISMEEHEVERDNVRRAGFFRGQFLKIAASILVILSVGLSAVYLYNTGAFSGKISFATDDNHKNLRIDLPDGSAVLLNRNSSLTYLKDFGKKTRNVTLTGEAFFEITPDKSHPFIIDAGRADVKVVGTSFNVKANNNDSLVEVYVKTGKVMLTDHESDQSVSLDPEYIGVIKPGVAEKNINSDPNYLSWNTGKLVYNGQKLDVVFRDLEKVYNMKITADDPEILGNLWTSPINNQPEETIVKLICVSFNLEYTKEGNIYHLSKK